MAPHPRIRHLFLDWDGTLTTQDTLSLVASIGYAHHHHHHHHLHQLQQQQQQHEQQQTTAPGSSATPSTEADTTPPLPPWTHFSDAYMHDYAQHARTREKEEQGGQSSTTPLTPPIRKTPLSRRLGFLNGLRPVERRSVERVERAGVFRGVTGAEVWRAAGQMVGSGEVRLRAGCEGVVALGMGTRTAAGGVGVGVGSAGAGATTRRGRGRGGAQMDISIVSVNWSAEFIRACLAGATGKALQGGEQERFQQHQHQHQHQQSHPLAIYANDISDLWSATGSPTGQLNRYFGGPDGGIWTGEDKARIVRQILKDDECAPKSGMIATPACEKGSGGEERGYVVYVGDSITDLECLVECADVGICVRDERMGSTQRGLARALEEVGVRVDWIGEWTDNDGGGGDGGGEVGSESDSQSKGDTNRTGSRKTVWWARDFREILDSPLMRGYRNEEQVI
ncbi:MAG: hypothetical protein M1819_002230 [Sarea resinae]|nr:MAG: hypothetical protein M1819_002230 [Sarea resinae]